LSFDMLGRVQKVSVAGEVSEDQLNRDRPLLDDQERRELTDQMLLAAAEVDFQEDIIRQRGEGITMIQRDVNRIHELFQDVAMHVSDQRQTLDHIEANVVSAAERTRNANEQLTSANSRGGSTRQNLLCLLLIVILILISLAMIKSLLRSSLSFSPFQSLAGNINSNLVRTFQI
jgi:syntaxin 7